MTTKTPNFIYFVPTPHTLKEGKEIYHNLSMKHHPDQGGTVEAMQQINAEWDYLKTRLPRFDTGVHTDYTARRAKEEAEAAREKSVAENLRPMVETLKRHGIKFDIVGSWIWSSDPKAKTIPGMSYSNTRKKWYYRPEEAASGSRGRRHSYDYIYHKYGGFDGTQSHTAHRERVTA